VKERRTPGAGREDKRDLSRQILLQISSTENTGGMPMFLLRPAVADGRSYGSAMQGFMGST